MSVVVVIVCCIKDNLQSISWPLNICLKPLKELIKTCRTKFSYISFSAQKIASINYIKIAIKCLETSKVHLLPRPYFFILIKMKTWQSLRILKTKEIISKMRETSFHINMYISLYVYLIFPKYTFLFPYFIIVLLYRDSKMLRLIKLSFPHCRFSLPFL